MSSRRSTNKPSPMDATSNFSLRFAQASESKVKMTDRLFNRQTLLRIGTGMSLFSLALGFAVLGMLIIVNRDQADLNGFSGGSFIAMVGGISAILVGMAFFVAACLLTEQAVPPLSLGARRRALPRSGSGRLGFAQPLH